MARTPSNMVPIGFEAPSFKLYDTLSNQTLDSDILFGDKCTLIMFICNHCPFVKHVNQEIVQLSKDYKNMGINFIAISSNDVVNYPEDSPEEMTKTGIFEKYTFPYLYDETQEIARNYDAACTPDFYVFDSNKKLIYRGQLDDSRPGNNIPLSGSDIRIVFDSVLESKQITINQKPSIGCNIKWFN
jgi:thiol-disulfide isomerase/thioredoxin|tara:strand:+ start:81 stop:638 length:558 start_codon:yes stop_codon:yes gene_type:complete